MAATETSSNQGRETRMRAALVQRIALVQKQKWLQSEYEALLRLEQNAQAAENGSSRSRVIAPPPGQVAKAKKALEAACAALTQHDGDYSDF